MLKRLDVIRGGLPRLGVEAPAIGAMVLLTAYLAPRASWRLLFFAVVTGGGLALLQRPRWGLVALVPVCLLVPVTLGTGTQTQVPLALALLVALLGTWLLGMLLKREWKVAPSQANRPLVAFIAVAALASLLGNILWNPIVQARSNLPVVQLAQWAIFILSAGAFWIAANLADEVRWLKRLSGLFLVLGALYIAQRLLAEAGNPVGRLYAGGADGCLFWVWLVALGGGQVLFNGRLHRSVRLALVGLLAATLYVSWAQGGSAWVSGWAPSLVALLVSLWLRSRRLGALVTVIAAIGVVLSNAFLQETIILSAQSDGSFLRLDAARGILQLVGNRWPIGLGLAAYPFYWLDLIGFFAYSPTNITRLMATERVNSHNNYLDIYAQMGLLGLGVFLWLAVALWRQGWQVRKAIPAGSFEEGYVNGCLAGLAGSLVAGLLADWFLPFVYNIGLTGMRSSLLGWLFLGGLAALARIRSSSVEPVK